MATIFGRGDPHRIGQITSPNSYAAQQTDGMRVLSGSGVETESELPFAGLHQLLWTALDRAQELPDVQAAALRGAFGLSADRVEDRFLVSVAVLGLLTAVADDEPLLCVVDDAHWLDAASADALVFVARRVQADPVAPLFAAREGDARRFEAPGLAARARNETLHVVFDESQVFRIDHFLGKETVQNILAARFGNGVFESIWNREHIDHVQIDVPETLSIGSRAGFYEGTGAFRDISSPTCCRSSASSRWSRRCPSRPRRSSTRP
jgi:hypothetical protein